MLPDFLLGAFRWKISLRTFCKNGKFSLPLEPVLLKHLKLGLSLTRVVWLWPLIVVQSTKTLTCGNDGLRAVHLATIWSFSCWSGVTPGNHQRLGGEDIEVWWGYTGLFDFWSGTLVLFRFLVWTYFRLPEVLPFVSAVIYVLLSLNN